MREKDRLLCALTGGTPDRVPYCEVGVSAQVLAGLDPAQFAAVASGGIDEMDARDYRDEIAISRLLQRDHICYRAFPPIPAERLLGSDGIPYYGDGAIKTPRDLEQLALPDPHGEEMWGDADAFLAGAGDYATCVVTRMGLASTYLAMGMESFSLSLYDQPQFVEAVMERYADWAIVVAQEASRRGFDFLWTADDLAFKTGPLLSPEMFRRIFLPHMRRVAAAIDIPWVFHSDGDLGELLPDLVDLGISALNPLEPGAMDIAAVKKRYGTSLCLIGNIDVHLLATGAPADIEREVRHLLSVVAPGGAFVLSSGNSLASYCKAENVRAMVDTLLRYGHYDA
jgi:uroporphyrinogen decarboxylase